MYVCACVPIHTHMHRHTLSHTHAQTYALTHTCTDIHSHTHMHRHTLSHTHAQTYTLTYTCTDIRSHIHMQTHTYSNLSILSVERTTNVTSSSQSIFITMFPDVEYRSIIKVLHKKQNTNPQIQIKSGHRKHMREYIHTYICNRSTAEEA